MKKPKIDINLLIPSKAGRIYRTKVLFRIPAVKRLCRWFFQEGRNDVLFKQNRGFDEVAKLRE